VKLRSYPKVWNMGHPAIADLFSGPVIVQEKVDGSQFSFGAVDGELFTRSRRVEVFEAAGIFSGAVTTARLLHEGKNLVDGWIYRAEALQKPKHNTIEYGRVPRGNIVLFDIDRGLEDRVVPEELASIAGTMNIESVPLLYEGEVESVEFLEGLLDRESFLGGAQIEGVVAKNQHSWGHDGKMLMGKVVRTDFQEMNRKTHAKRSRVDVVAGLVEMLSNEARYTKAVQRLRDDGSLTGEPKDIGPLIREVQRDIEIEAVETIKSSLYDHFRKDILRGASRGVPAWYKQQLIEQQFAGEA